MVKAYWPFEGARWFVREHEPLNTVLPVKTAANARRGTVRRGGTIVARTCRVEGSDQATGDRVEHSGCFVEQPPWDALSRDHVGVSTQTEHCSKYAPPHLTNARRRGNALVGICSCDCFETC